MDKLNRIVEGSKEWMQRIQTENSADGERMFSSESYFEAFWDCVGHGVAIISEDGKVIDANPAFCNLLEITYKQAVGLNVRQFVADGQWREDMRTIETMAIGRQGEIVTEERWNKKLNPNGPFIPVRVRAMRIPSERTRPFRHIILHVYDLRSSRYDMQGNNWANKNFQELCKELLMTHFGKIAFLIFALIVCMALNGNLGESIDKIIDSYTNKKPEIHYIQAPQETTPPNNVTQ